MNKIYRAITHLFFLVIVLFFTVAAAQAQIIIQNVQPADVTPSDFSIIWQTSEPATPGIVFYSDAAGINEVSGELEVVLFPLWAGDPEIVDEYQQEMEKEGLRDSAKQLGLMKIGVHGCTPETTYYYKVFAESDGNGVVWWPPDGTATVTTTEANAFISDAKQLLITLLDNGESLDATGWVVTASTDETLFPISAFVGDGAGANQAYLNLNHFFGADGSNWIPIGTREVTLYINGLETGVIEHIVDMDFSTDFHVSTVYPINVQLGMVQDTDGDGLPDDVETAVGSCTNVFDADSDDDGLPDGVEDANQNGVVDSGETDPCNADTDGDGIQDGTEQGVTEPVPDPDGDGPLLGTDTEIFVPDEDPASTTDSLDSDSDDDGIPDGSEDTDQDGLVDSGETDPDNPDTDGDAYDDGSEVYAGSDPLNGYSYPGVTIVQLKEGYNMIAIPADVTFVPDLRDWLPVLGDAMEVEKVMVYDESADSFVSVIPEDPANESFILQGGEGLIVYALGDKQIEFTTVFDSSLDLHQGFNLIGIASPPVNNSAYELLNSSALGPDNIASVQRYSPETGIFETAGFTTDGQIVGIDFPIIPGEGYFIFMRQEVLDFRFSDEQ